MHFLKCLAISDFVPILADGQLLYNQLSIPFNNNIEYRPIPTCCNSIHNLQ